MTCRTVINVRHAFDCLGLFGAGKSRLIGLPYGEKKTDDMLSRFHLIPERNGQRDGRTERRTDGQTDRFAISISRVSMLMRDKNRDSRRISGFGIDHCWIVTCDQHLNGPLTVWRYKQDTPISVDNK